MATKPIISNVATGAHYTATGLNQRFQALANAFANVVGTDGTNTTMTNNLQMNAKRIVDLGAPLANTDAARLIDINNAIAELTNAEIAANTVVAFRTDLATNTAGNGSDLIVVVGTTNTVTEEFTAQAGALSSNVAALESLISNAEANVALVETNVLALVGTLSVLPGFITGFESHTSHVDGVGIEYPTYDNDKINVSAGIITLGTGVNKKYGYLNTAITQKNVNSNWVEGSTAGAKPATVTLSNTTWYHLFALGKPNSTTHFDCDVGIDSSISATNLLADTNVVAAGYTVARRIGGLHWKDPVFLIQPYTQYGDTFEYDPWSPDQLYTISSNATGFTNVVTNYYLPADITVQAQIKSKVQVQGTFTGTLTYGITGTPVTGLYTRAQGTNTVTTTDTISVTGGNIYYSIANGTGANTNVHTYVISYKDNRGKDEIV